MLGFLSKNKLYVLILLPFIAALFWLRLFVNPTLVNVSSDMFQMPLYKLLLWTIPLLKTTLGSQIFTLPLLLTQAYIIALLGTNYKLFNAYSYLPSIIFVMLSGVLLPKLGFHPAHIGNIFILLSINQLFYSTKSENIFKPFFNIGLFVSIGSLFYIGVLPFYFAFFIALLFVQSFNWRLWVINFIGFLIPYAFYYTYLFLINGNLQELAIDLILSNILAESIPQLSEILLLFIGFIFIFSSISTIKLIYSLPLRNILVRRYYLTILILLISSIVFFIIIPILSIEMLLFALNLLALILSDFFISRKFKTFDNILFTGIAIISLVLVIIA